MSVANYIVIEAWHNRQLANIRFQDGFKLRAIFKTKMFKPDYVLEKTVGRDFTEIDRVSKQVLKKTYSFKITGDERMVDFLNIVKMCDNIVIKNNVGEINSAYEFDVQADWSSHDEEGFAFITCTFIIDPIIDKGCDDATDLIQSSLTVEDYIEESTASYTAPIANGLVVGKHYLVTNDSSGYSDGTAYAYKIEKLLPDGSWQNISVEYPYFYVENKRISVIGGNDWIYNGSIFHKLAHIKTLTNTSGTILKVTGNAVVNTLVKVEYKTGANPYSTADTVYQGEFEQDGVSFDVGGAGTWTVKITVYNNSGTYMTETKDITI